MTIVPLFLLTLGAINWGYAYPLVFLFVALLRQRMLGREIYFNFLYAPGFWLLLSAGMTHVCDPDHGIPGKPLYGANILYGGEALSGVRACRGHQEVFAHKMRAA